MLIVAIILNGRAKMFSVWKPNQSYQIMLEYENVETNRLSLFMVEIAQ